MTNVRIKDLPSDATPVDADLLAIDSLADGTRRSTFEVMRKAVLSLALGADSFTGHLTRSAADTYVTVRDNLSSITDPAVTDDSDDGYSIGSIWRKTVVGDGVGTFTGLVWICVRDNVDNAVWKRIWPALATDISAASDTAVGVVELATSAETITGTDATRAVTPAGLQAKTTSETVLGLVELATVAEAVTGTDTARAITAAGLAAHVAQPKARVVSGTTDTALAADIGNVVFVSQAAGCEVALNDMSGSLTSGRMQIFTWQCEGAATVLAINPGTSVTIDGSASNYVAPTGRARVSLFSRDGLAFFSGTP